MIKRTAGWMGRGGLMKMVHRNSLYQQLAMLVAVAFTVVCTLYFVVWPPLNKGICDYYESHPELSERQASSLVESLRQLVEENRIAAGQSIPLSDWVRRQSPIILTVYRGRMLLYDSTTFTSSILHTHVEQPSLPQTASSYEMEFADGVAQVMISVFPEHIMSEWASRALLLFCGVLFLAIILGGVRGTVRRVIRLEREVIAIAGGESGVITYAGSDELSLLAISIDEMRSALTRHTCDEEALLRERADWTTALSHDLRTPMTALRGYIEVMLRTDLPSRSHLEKCAALADRMKTMTDLLFSCFSSATLPRDDVVTVDGDVVERWIADRVDILAANGFIVDYLPDGLFIPILAHPLASERVLDNVFGNIIKYADPASAVSITTYTNNNYVTIRAASIAGEEASQDGTGLGLMICGRLMNAMGASIMSRRENNHYVYEMAWKSAHECGIIQTS